MPILDLLFGHLCPGPFYSFDLLLHLERSFVPNSVMVLFYLPLSEDPSGCPEVSLPMLPQGLMLTPLLMMQNQALLLQLLLLMTVMMIQLMLQLLMLLLLMLDSLQDQLADAPELIGKFVFPLS